MGKWSVTGTDKCTFTTNLTAQPISLHNKNKMVRKWLNLVDSNGETLDSETAVHINIEDVVTFRQAVKELFKDSCLVGVDPTGLIVYNAAHEGLDPNTSLVGLGGDEPITVQVPHCKGNALHYYILPRTRKRVERAVFLVKDADKVYPDRPIGVFFSPTLAVTWDCHLSDMVTVGGTVLLALYDEIAGVEVVARNHEMGFAILKSSKPRDFIPLWTRPLQDLEFDDELVLASFRLGIKKCEAMYTYELGCVPATYIAVDARNSHNVYSCPIYAGDAGAALILKNGSLVGIHLGSIGMVRESLDRKKAHNEVLNDGDKARDVIVNSRLGQREPGLMMALLAHEFKNAVSEYDA